MQFLQQSCFIVLFNQCLSANKVQKIAAKFNLKILIVDRGKVGGDSKNLQIKMKQTHKKGEQVGTPTQNFQNNPP
jgi:hypothetical protein